MVALMDALTRLLAESHEVIGEQPKSADASKLVPLLSAFTRLFEDNHEHELTAKVSLMWLPSWLPSQVLRGRPKDGGVSWQVDFTLVLALAKLLEGNHGGNLRSKVRSMWLPSLLPSQTGLTAIMRVTCG